MLKEGMTINDAAHEWVREMNAFPRDMIEMLMSTNPDDWCEVTKPSLGDRVYVYEHGYGRISSIDKGEDETVYHVELDEGTTAFIECSEVDFEVERDDSLPMWGTMWSFGDNLDDEWLGCDENLSLMSECGFRIFSSDEFGFFFGIDGSGYSFYEAHWIPLYKARGLQWHDERTLIPDSKVEKQLKEAGCSENIIKAIIKIASGCSMNFGGNYGMPIPKDIVEVINDTRKFSAEARHEILKGPNGYEEHDYCTVIRHA